MPSRLQTCCDALLEAVWLTALVAVPLHFNILSARVFEPDKVALVRSLAAFAVAIWMVKRLDGLYLGLGAHNPSAPVSGPLALPLWRRPLVGLVLALAAAYLLSTVLSVAPRQSLWGSYHRQQGALTMLSYVALFLVALDALRTRAMWQRLESTVILTSGLVALYGVLQRAGLDPQTWSADTSRRVTSTMGNAIFLAAYLILAVPVTLAALMQSLNRVRDTARRGGEVLRTCALAAVLLLQLAAIAFSQSRGPLLGLAAGLAFFAVLHLARQTPRRLWTGVGALAGAGVVAVALVVAAHARSTGPEAPSPFMRLGHLLGARADTVRSRTLIWEGAVATLKPHAPLTWPDGSRDLLNPYRAVVGYGPESMRVAFSRFYDPRLAGIEERTSSPDRAHNETFDSLIITGFLGALIEGLFFIAIFYHTLAWLGLITSRGARAGFFGLIAMGGLLGVGVPAGIGQIHLAGVGAPLGLLLGVLVYVMLAATRCVGGLTRPDRRERVLIALLAAVVAHLVEIQFGIAIAPTRTTVFVLLAVLVTVGTGQVSLSAEPQSSAPAPAPEPASNAAMHRRHSTAARVGKRRGGDVAPPSWRVILPHVLVAGIAMFVMGSALLTSRVLPLAGAWPVQVRAAQVASQVTALYSWLAVLVIALAATLAWPLPATRTWLHRPLLTGIAAIALGGGCLFGVDRINLHLVRADMLFKLAQAADRRGEHAASVALYDAISPLAPREDHYQIFRGDALLDLARATSNAVPRQLLLDRAGLVLRNARNLNPLNPDHSANLGRFQLVVAADREDPLARRAALEAASDYYAQALALSPQAAHLRNEWAAVYVQMGERELARACLERSLETDPRFAETYRDRAELALHAREWDAAMADYDEAARLGPTDARALRGRAYALSQLGRIDEAIAATRRLLELEPQDVTSLKNLAILCEKKGLTREAQPGR